MPGGLLQLSAWGAESELLMGNPQMTFFKWVFKRHTNFAQEPIEIPLDGNELCTDKEPLVLTCKIPRHADLLSHLYLEVDLPDIYSGYHKSIKDENIMKKAKASIRAAEMRKEAAAKAVEDAQAVVDAAEAALELQKHITMQAESTVNALVADVIITLLFSVAKSDAIEAARQVFEDAKILLAAKEESLKLAQDDLADAKKNLAIVTKAEDMVIAVAEAAIAGVIKRTRKRAYRFEWIKQLGTNMIQRVDLMIGGNMVERLHGGWIAIWQELFGKHNSLETFQQLTGDVEEMTNPAKAYSGGKGYYPTSTLDPSLRVDPELPAGPEEMTNPYLRPPSIRGRTLHIPLTFWFTQNIGLALPLIALQYHDVELRIELRPLHELYTVQEAKDGPLFGQRTPPKDVDHFITSFTTTRLPERFVNGAPLGDIDAAAQTTNKLNLNPRLLANYIFLDEDERTSFAAATSHEYLIETVRKHTFDGVVGQRVFELDLKHPVKTLVWHAQRDDFLTRNMFSNYTNWEEPTLHPSSYTHKLLQYGSRHSVLDSENSPHVYDVHTIDTERMGVANIEDELPTKFSFKQFDRDIIRRVTLLYNGIKRFDTREASFYSKVQMHQNQMEGRIPGVNMYSYALTPTHLQPSGTCNMSRVRRVQMDIETTPVDTEDTENDTLVHKHKYNISIYVQHNNLLRIASGMAGLGFHN